MADYTALFKRIKTLADGACTQLKTLREMRPYDQLKTELTACKNLAAELKRVIKYHSLARGTAEKKFDAFLRQMLAAQDSDNEHYYLEPEWCQSDSLARKAWEKHMVLRLCAMAVPRDDNEIARGFSTAKAMSVAAVRVLGTVEDASKPRTIKHLTVYDFETARTAAPRR